MRKNVLREKIRQNEPTIGTRILIAWPGLVDIIGNAQSYDYVEFVSEYAPYNLYDFENLARAADLAGISSMIKIDQEPRTYLAERALTAGIQNVLFADIRNARDADNAVKAIRSEPDGENGFRLDRRLGYVSTRSSMVDQVKMCEETVVALMIEKGSAVENLEEILSVKGVDMVQFGPSDYSLSIGLPGQTKHPRVRRAEFKTIKTALKMGVEPRAEIRNPKDAKKYIELGVKNFSIGTDVRILYSWWKKNGEELRRVLTEM